MVRPAAVAMPPGSEAPHGYRLERVLGGRSGVSTVYAAADDGGGGEVALRIFTAELSADPEFRAEFTRTVRAHAGLAHPNLVRVVDSSAHQARQGRQDDSPLFIALELVEGATLGERIAFAPFRSSPRCG